MAEFILSAFADEIDTDLGLQLETLRSHGIRYLELRGVGGKNIGEHTVAEVREIRKRLDAAGIGVSSIGSPIGKIKIADPFGPHLDKFKLMLEFAHILDADYIRMFSFFMPEHDDPAKYRGEVIDRWGGFIGAAKGSSVTLLHENEKDIYGDTAARCKDLLDSLKCPYFKAAFDPANFVQCGEQPYPYAFELLKPYVVYMHIKDARSSDGVNVPAGEGDGKFPEILADLKRADYSGFLSLEPHLGMFAGLADLEPGTAGFDLPEGGPRTFAVAVHALNKIISAL